MRVSELCVKPHVLRVLGAIHPVRDRRGGLTGASTVLLIRHRLLYQDGFCHRCAVASLRDGGAGGRMSSRRPAWPAGAVRGSYPDHRALVLRPRGRRQRNQGGAQRVPAGALFRLFNDCKVACSSMRYGVPVSSDSRTNAGVINTFRKMSIFQRQTSA